MKSDRRLSRTNIDWSPLARKITAPYRTAREKHFAIYRYLCDNIAYDTTYKIYTADECIRSRKGVCQAYSEVYLQLAHAAGLRAKYVSGITRTETGSKDFGRHAWVIAYEDNGRPMLIDPTWGAGSVSGSTFIREKRNNTWFDVSAYWMIFTHLPSDEADQLMLHPISRAQFESLPAYRPYMQLFGFHGKEIFKHCLSGQIPELPNIYYTTMREHGIKKMTVPTQRHLPIGKTIEITIDTNLDHSKFCIIDESAMYYYKGSWSRQNGRVYCYYTPMCAGDVSVCVERDSGAYLVLAKYKAV